MYVSGNPRSKKELVERVKAGKKVEVFSPGPFPCPQEGVVSVEGPHYPEPHRWYAMVKVRGGYVVEVLGARR